MPTTSDSLSSFLVRKGDLVLGLTVFMDETGTHAGHPITAVAGVLFDQSGINDFEAIWVKRTPDLKEPFRAADCYGGYGQFEGWPTSVRLLLMHDLAEIIAKTRLAGFVAFIEQKDWELWAKINPQHIQWVGSPYSACLSG